MLSGEGEIMEKKTILLVEDDRVLMNLIEEALERQYNILEAVNCHEAIKQVKKPIDLALIDYSLPDGNGLDVLLKALKEVKPDLPVIMMTAYSTDNLAINAFRSGVVDYLKKPFTLGRFTEFPLKSIARTGRERLLNHLFFFCNKRENI